MNLKNDYENISYPFKHYLPNPNEISRAMILLCINFLLSSTIRPFERGFRVTVIHKNPITHTATYDLFLLNPIIYCSI